MVAMGIPFGFDSTQGKKVDDEAANTGAVKVKTTRTARQYMNRKVCGSIYLIMNSKFGDVFLCI